MRTSSALILCLAACFVAAVSGCGGIGGDDETSDSKAAKRERAVPALDPEQRVSIVWESYNLADAGETADVLQDLVSRFEEQHPNITVEARAPRNDDSTASVQQALAAGNAPDVAQLVFGDLRYLVEDLGVAALDDLYGADEVRAALTGGAHPFQPEAAVLGDLDGKTYGVPFVVSTPVLFYNADLFEQAGLDPADPPQTWDEIQHAAAAIARKTSAGGFYTTVADVISSDWAQQAFLRSNGGRAISEDGTELTWADAESVAAVQTLHDLAAGGELIDSGTDDARDQMMRGKLGMLIDSSFVQSQLLEAAEGKFEVRSAGMPAFGDRPPVPVNSGAALFVTSTDPTKQAAAWEFVKFMTSPETQAVITADIGYLPLRSGLMDDPSLLGGDRLTEQQRDLLEPNLAQLERLEPWASYPGKDYGQIRTLFLEAVRDAIYRSSDVAGTLAKAQERASRLMRDAG